MPWKHGGRLSVFDFQAGVKRLYKKKCKANKIFGTKCEDFAIQIDFLEY